MKKTIIKDIKSSNYVINSEFQKDEKWVSENWKEITINTFLFIRIF